MENKITLELNSWVSKLAELRSERDRRLGPTHSIENQTSRWLDETNLKVKNIIVIEGRTFSRLNHGLSKDKLQITILETKRTQQWVYIYQKVVSFSFLKLILTSPLFKPKMFQWKCLVLMFNYRLDLNVFFSEQWKL